MDSTSNVWSTRVLILLAIWVVFIWPHTDTWEGEGTVNLFPDGDYTKNYRLDGYIEVTRHRNGWLYSLSDTQYKIVSVNWPNGGNISLTDCVMKSDQREVCSFENGQTYAFEVDSPPLQPESDSYEDQF